MTTPTLGFVAIRLWFRALTTQIGQALHSLPNRTEEGSLVSKSGFQVGTETPVALKCQKFNIDQSHIPASMQHRVSSLMHPTARSQREARSFKAFLFVVAAAVFKKGPLPRQCCSGFHRPFPLHQPAPSSLPINLWKASGSSFFPHNADPLSQALTSFKDCFDGGYQQAAGERCSPMIKGGVFCLDCIHTIIFCWIEFALMSLSPGRGCSSRSAMRLNKTTQTTEFIGNSSKKRNHIGHAARSVVFIIIQSSRRLTSLPRSCRNTAKSWGNS